MVLIARPKVAIARVRSALHDGCRGDNDNDIDTRMSDAVSNNNDMKNLEGHIVAETLQKSVKMYWIDINGNAVAKFTEADEDIEAYNKIYNSIVKGMYYSMISWQSVQVPPLWYKSMGIYLSYATPSHVSVCLQQTK